MTHVNSGRYSVSEDGTLSISPTHLYDSGRYVCTAVNDFGSVRAAVNILVTGLLLICPETSVNYVNTRLSLCRA